MEHKCERCKFYLFRNITATTKRGRMWLCAGCANYYDKEFRVQRAMSLVKKQRVRGR